MIILYFFNLFFFLGKYWTVLPPHNFKATWIDFMSFYVCIYSFCRSFCPMRRTDKAQSKPHVSCTASHLGCLWLCTHWTRSNDRLMLRCRYRASVLFWHRAKSIRGCQVPTAGITCLVRFTVLFTLGLRLGLFQIDEIVTNINQVSCRGKIL